MSELILSNFKKEYCLSITKTYLYNFDPLKAHFYIVKLGLTGVHLFFLFLFKNLHSLEPPHWGGSNEYHNLCFEQKYEKYQIFYLKVFSFWKWNFQYIWIGIFTYWAGATGYYSVAYQSNAHAQSLSLFVIHLSFFWCLGKAMHRGCGICFVSITKDMSI